MTKLSSRKLPHVIIYCRTVNRKVIIEKSKGEKVG